MGNFFLLHPTLKKISSKECSMRTPRECDYLATSYPSALWVCSPTHGLPPHSNTSVLPLTHPSVAQAFTFTLSVTSVS